MKEPRIFSITYFDGETTYLEDSEKNIYCLDVFSLSKEDLRGYTNIEPTDVEKDEDGDLSFYYDDDSWDIDYDIVEAYITDFIKRGCEIVESGDIAKDGDIFKVIEGDNGWHETYMDYKLQGKL
tara:strand:- start:124 stop:495 length:372 start_codon:yes stop_codon:yes gene_type:complete